MSDEPIVRFEISDHVGSMKLQAELGIVGLVVDPRDIETFAAIERALNENFSARCSAAMLAAFKAGWRR